MTTLESHIQMFLDDVSVRITASTLEVYRCRLQRLSSFAGSRPVSKMLAQQWVTSMFEEGLKHYYVYKVCATIVAFFDWLVDREMVAANPVRKPKISYVKTERPIITLEDHERILPVADADSDEEVWPYAVRCAWETGMRISDIALLKWEGVLWEQRGFRTLPLKTQRNGRYVEVPISDEFFAFMQEWWLKQGRPGSGYVSEQAASIYKASFSALNAHFEIIARRAKVFDKTIHCYRHGFVTRMLARGISAEIISTMTAQSVQQVMQYQHLSIEDKRLALGFEPLNSYAKTA